MNRQTSGKNLLMFGLGAGAAVNGGLGLLAGALVATVAFLANTAGSMEAANEMMTAAYAIVLCCPFGLNVVALAVGFWWGGPRFAGGWLLGLLVGLLIGGCAITMALALVPVAP